MTLISSIAPIDEHDQDHGSSRHGSQKHQAIFHIDKAQYHAIIDAYEIKESIIDNRQSQGDTGPGARGWYN